MLSTIDLVAASARCSHCNSFVSVRYRARVLMSDPVRPLVGLRLVHAGPAMKCARGAHSGKCRREALYVWRIGSARVSTELCDPAPFVGEELPFVGASAPLVVDRLRPLLRHPTVAPASRGKARWCRSGRGQGSANPGATRRQAE